MRSSRSTTSPSRSRSDGARSWPASSSHVPLCPKASSQVANSRRASSGPVIGSPSTGWAGSTRSTTRRRVWPPSVHCSYGSRPTRDRSRAGRSDVPASRRSRPPSGLRSARPAGSFRSRDRRGRERRTRVRASSSPLSLRASASAWSRTVTRSSARSLTRSQSRLRRTTSPSALARSLNGTRRRRPMPRRRCSRPMPRWRRRCGRTRSTLSAPSRGRGHERSSRSPSPPSTCSWSTRRGR